jgi:hypothetical protein
MIPVDQDRFGDGEGNCWAACMASILERPLSDLHAFHEAYLVHTVALTKSLNVAPEIRTAHHVQLARATGHAVIWLHLSLDPLVPRGYAIASGPGHRGCDHAVVALDGVVVHDPHPSRDGLESISYFEILIPIIWPADHIRLAAMEGPHAPT